VFGLKMHNTPPSTQESMGLPLDNTSKGRQIFANASPRALLTASIAVGERRACVLSSDGSGFQRSTYARAEDPEYVLELGKAPSVGVRSEG
jgi:hypothetical protein